MRKGLIIFDFDGTLGDTRRNIVTTMQMTINELQLPYRSEDECASTIGLPLAECFKTMFPDLQESFLPRCAETYRRIFNENLLTIKPEAFPGVVATLSALKERGYTLTIASSRSRNSLKELTHDLGIADYISYLIGADDVKESKPNPEPVLKTLADMHFNAGETLVVGDMAVDILMGANAGAKTCGVTWGNGTKNELENAGATFIIDRMEEILELTDITTDLVPQSGLKKVTIDIVKANIFAVVIMVVSAIVFLVPFFWIWAGKKPISELFGGFGDWSINIILVIVGIVVHELIHGLTWACYAKSGWKSISFGVMWKLLTPYCHCNEPMHIPGYMMGGMMPCIILGVIPAIAALFIGSLPLLAWGIFFIAAAAGDIWMTWLLTKENPKSMVLDHPSEAGFYIID